METPKWMTLHKELYDKRIFPIIRPIGNAYFDTVHFSGLENSELTAAQIRLKIISGYMEYLRLLQDAVSEAKHKLYLLEGENLRGEIK